MRVLQIYNFSFIQSEVQALLLIDFSKMEYTFLSILRKKLFDIGFFLYPIYSQVLEKLCPDNLIAFFKNVKTSHLKMYFLLIPFPEKKSVFEDSILMELDELKKNNFCSIYPFFFYNNFFIDISRRFLLNQNAIFLYKKFYISFLRNTSKFLFLSSFFLMLVKLLLCFKLLFLKKTNFSNKNPCVL